MSFIMILKWIKDMYAANNLIDIKFLTLIFIFLKMQKLFAIIY